MEAGRKRWLLARIDGRLWRLDVTDFDSGARCWQQIDNAMRILRDIPLESPESGMREKLEQHVRALRDGLVGGEPVTLLAHRRTLARVDCVLWQMHLRRLPGIPAERPSQVA